MYSLLTRSYHSKSQLERTIGVDHCGAYVRTNFSLCEYTCFSVIFIVAFALATFIDHGVRYYWKRSEMQVFIELVQQTLVNDQPVRRQGKDL